MKRSISSHTLDFSKDPKKRVTFEHSGKKLRSAIRGPGEKEHMQETISLSKSQKLLSPFRKRTTAYTQATKSSMKESKGDRTKDANVSLHSLKQDRDTTISPLRATTPAKMTQASRSRLDRSEDEEDSDLHRGEHTTDPNKSMYGIPRTIDQIESTSALVEHLKSLLKNALDREDQLANYIEQL